MPLLTIRGYARHRRLSHVAVLKAIRTGRIRRTEDGLIDCEQADRDWARNTHPAPRAPRAVPATMTADAGFARARTVREHYEALLVKDDYERRSAELGRCWSTPAIRRRNGAGYDCAVPPNGICHRNRKKWRPQRVHR